MQTEEIKVLFMDDEPDSDPVQEAIEQLGQAGCRVNLVQSMHEAMQAFYQEFYHVFVLDIDMSHVQDDQEGDGVNVLKGFMSVHNKTRVILFSGAGTVEHWFAAANAHCYAYVAKDEKNSLHKLVSWVQASQEEESGLGLRESRQCPARILAMCGTEELKNQVQSCVPQGLGREWSLEFCSDLQEMAYHLDSQAQDYGLVLICKQAFDLWPETTQALDSICAHGPSPQVIVCCRGGRENELRSSILYLANRHPFRMINIDEANWPDKLEKALDQARIWYGRREVFQADPDALRRMHITLPNEWSETEDLDPSELIDDQDLDDEEWV